MTMTRAQLIASLAEKYRELNPKLIDLGVREIIEMLSETLIDGGRIEIRGFGSFEVRKRGATTTYDPRSGQPIPGEKRVRKVVHFKPGVELRLRVNRMTDM